MSRMVESFGNGGRGPWFVSGGRSAAMAGGGAGGGAPVGRVRGSPVDSET